MRLTIFLENYFSLDNYLITSIFIFFIDTISIKINKEELVREAKEEIKETRKYNERLANFMNYMLENPVINTTIDFITSLIPLVRVFIFASALEKLANNIKYSILRLF